MRKLHFRFTVLFLLVFLSTCILKAQNKLWPGDANNNGITNCVDLLYIGVGYNENGPIRNNATTLWQEQLVDSLWANDYQDNTTNYAYGDCNGDGVINDIDLISAIKANYKLMHSSNTALSNADAYMPSDPTKPVLDLQPDKTTVTEGEEIKINFNLGEAGLPIDSFYGVAMVVSYDRPFVDMSTPIQFTNSISSFANPTNANIVSTVFTDTLNQQFELAYVRTNRLNANTGHGTLGTFSFIIDDDVIAPLAIDTITLTVDSVRVIDREMNSIPVNFESASFKVEVLQSARSSFSTNCPAVLDPVCGINGVTYANSCFAKAAGITEFTSGLCYSDCIEPTDIDVLALANCSNNYAPVCGCNDVTYLNSCVAENSGVVEYTIGACIQNTQCYDPSIIGTSAGIDIDSNTGVIDVYCSDDYEPVCGCDGFTYQNSCLAEASGITFYTQGSCTNICVDPNAMNPNANCVNVYEPVCGCNDVTYTNACFAEAAGVVDYTTGTCGGSSSGNWCDTAKPIQCGDYLASETTLGTTNDIVSYYWNSAVQYLGPDKVYVINKDQAGDLQIGLEIITPGINLDLFLLSGDCDNLTCIASSQSTNATSNNEGIVFENAPIGTYYIVVDGLLPSDQGDYKFEVSCGDLDCSNSFSLQCGLPFKHTNSNGDDNVSAYGCGSVLNVENNGNEVVHTFAVTQAGQVDIYLSKLNANLELFLLSECDRGTCAEFSSKPGNADEHISTYLQAGVYYVVVDGYNGAISNYQLLVDCPSTCNLNVAGSTTGTNCGQSNGSFTINSTGGTPGFIVSWSGPVSGSFSTNANSCTIYNLPPGTYEVTKTDAIGCSDKITLEISDFGSQLEAVLNVNNAVCNTNGSVHVALSNGTAPYQINISGPTNSTAVSVSNSFTINQLTAGVYTLYITDKNGCTIAKTFTIVKDNNNFTISGYTTDSQCESLGKIHISLANGKPTYTIHVSGPVSGSTTTNSSSFNIPNLPGGTYRVVIEDANWCSDEMIFIIDEKDIDINLVPTNGICGDNGSLTINISSGKPNYNITWSGPSSGNVTSASPTFTIPSLPSGTYSVTVMDANWCQDYQVVTIDNTISSLDVDISTTGEVCGIGSVWIDINNGTAPYSITYSGPESGTGITSTNGYNISDLSAGTYWIDVEDYNHCAYSVEVEIDSNNDNIDVSAWPNDGVCGDLGNVEVTISNGSAPYIISYTGPASNTITSSSSIYIIEDLVPGTYEIEVTDINGCQEWVSAVLSNAGSELSITTSPWNGVCGTPGEIIVEIDGGAPDYTIVWDGPSAGTNTVSNSIFTIYSAQSGNYGITVTDGQGCTDYSTQIINNDANNLSIVVDAQNGQCGNPGSVDLMITGGSEPYQVSWSGQHSGAGTTNSDFSINNLQPGTYDITVQSNNGCINSTHIEIINEAKSPIVTVSSTPSLCGNDGAINLIYDASDVSLTWAGPILGSAMSSGGIFTIEDAPAGWYDIVVSGGNQCDVQVGVEVIEIENNVDFTVTPTNGICQTNGSASIEFGAGSFEIIWTGPVNGNAVDDSGLFVIQNLPDGDYVVTLLDEDECEKTKSFTISTTQTQIDIVATPTNGVCDLLGSIKVEFNTGGGLVSWDGPSVGSSTSSNGEFTILNLVSGVYIISVEANDGCTNSTSVQLFNMTEDVSFSVLAENAICNTNGSFEITSSLDIVSIDYSGPITGTSTPDINGMVEIQNLPAGFYTLTATSLNGCSADQDVELSTITNPLNLNATVMNDLCNQGGSAAISFTAGEMLVSWSGPVSGSTVSFNGGLVLNDLPNGDYMITITDLDGCQANTNFTINNSNNNILTISATAVNGSCGQAPGFLMNISGGAPAYIISWTGPENGTTTTNNNVSNVDNLTPGTYNVSVVDSNGCSETADVTITGNSNSDFDASFDVTNAYCNVLGSIWINVSSGLSPYLIEWTGPQSGSYTSSNVVNDISNLPVGTYTATITDANACSLTQTLTVIENGMPTQFTTTNVNPTNTNDGSILVNIITNNPNHTISWTGPVNGTVTVSGQFFNITSLPEGNYSVTVEDKDGCSSTQYYVLTNSGTSSGASFAINVNATDMTCGELGNLFISMNNGVAPYMIAWEGADSGIDNTNNSIYSIPDLGMGGYSVTVTDADGNAAIGSTDISGSGAFEIVTSTNNGSCGNDDGSISIVVNSGAPNYTIFWSGPISNSAVFTNNAITINDLPSGTYNITVSDANACPYIFTTEIMSTVAAPTANYASVNNALTTSFINNASSGLYTWDFGDGNTSSATNPIHEFCDPGTYTVCLTVLNTCGSNTVCNDITVSIPTDVAVLDIQNINGSPGSMLSVPVIISNCESLVSLAGSLAVFDDEVCLITGIKPGIINPNYFVANSTFSYVDNNGAGINTEEGDILFYIDVELIGEGGEATELYITEDPLRVELGSMLNGFATEIPSVQLKGVVSISNSVRISGSIKTYWGEGIQNTEVTIQGANVQNAQMTDEEGYYMEPDLPMGEMYEVIPSRDFNNLNGLSSYALFVGQRFILGMDPVEIVSPYQVIAGDANCSNSFSTIDLFILQQLIIGTNDELDFCPSWTFVKENDQMPEDFDAYNVFPYNSFDQIMVMTDEVSNFVGVKVGDILGHANPNNFVEDDELTRSSNSLDVFVNNINVKKGQSFDLSFTSANFQDIVSFQLGMTFDQSKLSFVESIKSIHEELAATAIGESNVENGRLRASWFSLDGDGLSVSQDTKLFTLRFTANAEIDNVLEHFNFDNETILTEAHNINLERLEVNLEEGDEITSVDLNVLDQFTMSQNTPNPFYETTQIEINLPRSMHADLTITNTLGEVVKIIQQQFNQGVNLITLDQEELGSGVFQYTLTADGHRITKSLISLK